MKTFLIIGITLVAGLFIAGAFAVSTAGSTAPPSAAVLIDKTITANGIYDASDDGADGFSQVTVNVPATTPDLTEKTITANGIYDASDDGADGFSQVTVNVPALLDSQVVFDCGGNYMYGNVLILNHVYDDHFGLADSSGNLILNVCGVYWNVLEDLLSLDNGDTWETAGIYESNNFVSVNSNEVWTVALINLPDTSLGVTVVENTLEYTNISQMFTGSGFHYEHKYQTSNPALFIPLTSSDYSWNYKQGINILSVTVDKEIED